MVTQIFIVIIKFYIRILLRIYMSRANNCPTHIWSFLELYHINIDGSNDPYQFNQFNNIVRPLDSTWICYFMTRENVGDIFSKFSYNILSFKLGTHSIYGIAGIWVITQGRFSFYVVYFYYCCLCVEYNLHKMIARCFLLFLDKDPQNLKSSNSDDGIGEDGLHLRLHKFRCHFYCVAAAV